MVKKIVKCDVCGKHIIAYGNMFFRHCGKGQDIQSHLINGETSFHKQEQKKTAPVNNPQEATQEQKTEKEGETTEKQEKTKYEAPKEPQGEDLDVEPAQEDKGQDQDQENKFKCPLCGASVEEYKDCSSCGAEITWQED